MRTSVVAIAFVAGLAAGFTSPTWARDAYAQGRDVVQYILDTQLMLYLEADGLRAGCFL